MQVISAATRCGSAVVEQELEYISSLLEVLPESAIKAALEQVFFDV